MVVVQSYGSLSASGKVQPRKRALHNTLAVVGVLAATVAVLAVCLVSVGGRTALLQKSRGGGLVSSVENVFSDDGQQLASDPESGWEGGYADGVTGARLDEVSATSLAEEEKEEEEKEERIPDPLDKAGIAVDHWPWDAKPALIPKKKGEEEPEKETEEETEEEAEKEEKASMVESLMGAFQDKPHTNPLLSKHQLAALRQQQAEEAEEQHALEQEREEARLKRQKQAQEQKELQRLYAEKAAQRREQEEREQMEQQRFAASSQRQQPRHSEEAAQPKTATLPHPHQKQRAAHQAPEDAQTRMARREGLLSKGLAEEAVALERMLREGGGGADSEEEAAQGLQEAAFQVQKLAALQAALQSEEAAKSHAKSHKKPDLEGGHGLDAWSKEDLLGKDFDGTLQLFPSWYWTVDSAKGLEEAHQRRAAEQRAARKEGAWEKAVAAKLREDASDMSQLAASDAQRGFFRGPVLAGAAGEGEGEGAGAGAGEEAGNATAAETGEHCNQDTQGCHKLEKVGVPVDHWPWAEAQAKREWERRLARQVSAEAKTLRAVSNGELAELRRQQGSSGQARASARPTISLA